MSKYDGATVEVSKWKDYNPRTDSKKPSWFRLDNDFVTGPKYFGLSGAQKLLLVLIFGLVSQKNGEALILNYQYLKVFTELDDNGISQAIDIFIEKETLRVTRARSARHSRVSRKDSHATDERTNETDERDETNVTARPPARTAGKTIPTWEAYRDAYAKRYGEPPIRNATVNAQLSGLLKRLGEEESPLVAEFYVSHNDQFYVKSMHTVGLLLRDAEKLRTEWVTGKRMTGTIARQAETRSGNAEVIRDFYENKNRGQS